MFSQTNGNPTTIDPNTARAIQEITRLVQDVEQRVQYVKLGLLQSFPQLATSGLSLGVPANLGIPNGLQAGLTGLAGLTGQTPVLLQPISAPLPWGMTGGYPTGYPTQPLAYVLPSTGAPSSVVTTPFGTFPASLPTFRF